MSVALFFCTTDNFIFYFVFFFGVAFFFLVFGNSKTTDSYGLSGISNLYGLPSHSPFLAL